MNWTLDCCRHAGDLLYLNASCVNIKLQSTLKLAGETFSHVVATNRQDRKYWVQWVELQTSSVQGGVGGFYCYAF